MAVWGTYKEVTNAYSHTRGSSVEKFAAGATEAVEGISSLQEVRRSLLLLALASVVLREL